MTQPKQAMAFLRQRINTIKAEVSVKIDLGELTDLMHPEQIAALMGGIGKVVAAGNDRELPRVDAEPK